MDADKVIKRFMDLRGRRTEWESAWRMCSDHVLPRLGKYSRPNSLSDSTAPLALGRFGAAMESFLTPRTYRWHKLVTGSVELDALPDVARYLETVTDILFSARYAPEANFANQIMEAYLSLGVHGTAVIFVDDAPGMGPRYRHIPVHEVFLAENAFGVVDTVFREYRLTARQAAQEFENLPERVRDDALDPARQETPYDFIHAVFPRADYDRTRADSVNMPVASVHIEQSSRQVVRESGYRVMPYAVSRFQVADSKVYGRSPAMDVMPDITLLNAMKKSIRRAGELTTTPPLLTADDDVLHAFSLKPGSLNFGGLDEQGRPRVVPLDIKANLPVAMELVEQSRTVINDAFFISLFQILVEAPQQTATEVVQRAQEKAQLLAPVMGRQQSELLRPIIEREMDILAASGALPNAPEEMAINGRAEVFPKYETTMANALNSQDGLAIVQALQAVGLLVPFAADAGDNINAAEAARELWRGFGAPAKALRSQEEVEAMRLQKAQAQQEMMMLEQMRELARGAGGAAAGGV